MSPLPASSDATGWRCREVPGPFVALDAALRADVDRLTDVAAAIAGGDVDRVEPFVDRVEIFGTAMHVHTRIVDELVVPDVARRRPDARAVVARLEAQHTELDTLALRARDRAAVLDPLVRGWEVVAVAVARDFAALRRAVHTHLDDEHRDFAPVWCDSFDAEDQGALPGAVRALMGEGLALLVAWVASAAGEGAAGALLDGAPPELRRADAEEWRPAYGRRPAARL